MKEKPYIVKIVEELVFNPNYDYEEPCKCGHPYYRHFDTYKDMYPCGCEYCGCFIFKEKE